MLDLIQIGVLQKAFGIKGDANFYLLDQTEIINSNLDFVFVVSNGSVVPFKLDYIDFEQSQLRFRDFPDPQSLKPLLGSKMYLESKYLNADNELSLKNTEEQKWNDFEVYNTEQIKIGVVLQLISYPSHFNLEIENADKEHVLIPFHQDLIVKIDDMKKTMILDLPEGF